jgi:VIT1/CCC1 family predicted Fe2+/Mn2+ transporter
MTPASTRFVHRYLDAGDRLGEILFGLIMVLTFTLAARATLGEEGSARELLIAALGCNIAWGLIDGGMYIMGAMLERARASGARTRVTGEDIKGAFACCWLVIASALPAIAPFLVMNDAHRALRTSNALLAALLFAVGYQWGGYAKTSRWIAGLVFLVIGLILIAVAIALGG